MIDIQHLPPLAVVFLVALALFLLIFRGLFK